MGRVGVEVSVAWGEKKRGLEKMGLHRESREKKGTDLMRLGPCMAKTFVIDLKVNLRYN